MELQKAELVWAQKYGKDKSGAGSSRPAASYTLCYCCGTKGHYARDYPQAGSARCNYCKKNNHLERACKLKKDKEGAGGGSSGEHREASFFHGEFTCAMAELTHGDSNHSVEMLQQSTDSLSTGEALATGHMTSSTNTFLADSGASHHICHERASFCKLAPLPGPFKIQQVQGTVDVTHSGTVMVEVDSVHGKVPLTLKNVLFIPSMDFNILSMQKMVAADFIPVYNEIPGKVVIKKILQQGGVEKVALLSISTSGRLTLDCRISHSHPLAKEKCS